MKYKYNIKNLDCANCAKKIEEKLNKDKNIKNTIVNFSASTVTRCHTKRRKSKRR